MTKKVFFFNLRIFASKGQTRQNNEPSLSSGGLQQGKEGAHYITNHFDCSISSDQHKYDQKSFFFSKASAAVGALLPGVRLLR